MPGAPLELIQNTYFSIKFWLFHTIVAFFSKMTCYSQKKRNQPWRFLRKVIKKKFKFRAPENIQNHTFWNFKVDLFPSNKRNPFLIFPDFEKYYFYVQKGTFYHPPGSVSSTPAPPGYLSKIIKFQPCLQDPQKSEKVPPGSPKDTKMWPTSTPRDNKSVNK